MSGVVVIFTLNIIYLLITLVHRDIDTKIS